MYAFVKWMCVSFFVLFRFLTQKSVLKDVTCFTMDWPVFITKKFVLVKIWMTVNIENSTQI